MKTEDFQYDLPPSSIAQEAIEPRHDARLLDTRTMADHRFLDLPELLEAGDLVVVNSTKVRPARLDARRASGGRVELLLLGPSDNGTWTALARPSRRLRSGETLRVDDAELTLVGDPNEGRVAIETDRDLEALAARVGDVPLPPYFTGSLLDPDRYQTMFADRVGSAAAPTAGLHFTDEVVRALDARGVGLANIELEVGLDTFRPISTETLDAHVMHRENVLVSDDTVDRITEAQESGGRVVAIGTTVVRALESAGQGGLSAYRGSTDLFITPGFRFGVVDLIVTNFHVPGSTLIVLVAAALGERWREAYQTALDREYRFLSFGDGMLVETPRS